MAKRLTSGHKASLPAFLDDVAVSDIARVVETPSGKRLVVLSEKEYLRLTNVSSPPRVPRTLSAREHQILSMAGSGLSSAEIAAELALARNTVAQHLQSVRRKFGVTSTAAAIEIAAQLPQNRLPPT
jgi:DNA-binding CsgD family transcriptional regulator